MKSGNLQFGHAVPQVQATVLPRLRGDYHTFFRSSHYDSWEEDLWEADPDGPLLSSRLRKGDHAPVLDVDRPITAEPSEDGTLTTLRIPDLTARQARKVLDGIATNYLPVGLIVGLRMTPHAITSDRIRSWHKVTLNLIFAANIHVHPSATPGHHHVLVNTPMAWGHAVGLARALAGPVVDTAWLRANESGKRMVIARPKSPDACC